MKNDMKKQTIRIAFEYHAHPVWVYDEEDCLIDNGLPVEWQHDKQLDVLCNRLQNIFDGLFLDDGKRFVYLGFATAAEKAAFLKQTEQLYTLLCERNHANRKIHPPQKQEI